MSRQIKFCLLYTASLGIQQVLPLCLCLLRGLKVQNSLNQGYFLHGNILCYPILQPCVLNKNFMPNIDWTDPLTSGLILQPSPIEKTHILGKKRSLNTRKCFWVSFSFRGKLSWQPQSEFFMKVKFVKNWKYSINVWPKPFFLRTREKRERKGEEE